MEQYFGLSDCVFSFRRRYWKRIQWKHNNIISSQISYKFRPNIVIIRLAKRKERRYFQFNIFLSLYRLRYRNSLILYDTGKCFCNLYLTLSPSAISEKTMGYFGLVNPLNSELNPICYLLALLGAHHFPYVRRIRVKLLTFRLLMSYIYGAPILDVSRSHTTTHHSR